MTMSAIQIGTAPLFHHDISLHAKLKQTTSLSVKSESATWGTDICFFQIPEFIRRRWWDVVADEMLADSVDRTNFNAFVDAFKDFAFFKQMPLTVGLEFNVLVRAPSKCNNDIENNSFTAIINLGDEQTTIIIENETIILNVGDGCWAPNNSAIHLADTSEKNDIDVLFTISDFKSNNRLQHSIGIYNFIREDQLHERVLLSNGVCLANETVNASNYIESAYLPRNPWRKATQHELHVLTLNKLPDVDVNVNTVGILRVPSDVMTKFIALNLSEVRSHDELMQCMNTTPGKNAINAARQFAHSLTSSVHDLETKIIFNQPNLPTTTHLPGEHQYIGLHIDYNHQQSIFTRKISSNRISINISNEDRYFLFVNLSVTQIIRLISPSKNCTTNELSQMFFERFPDYPVVKLRVAPGEAYIAPTQNIIHDGIGPKISPDIHLTFCGYIDLGSKVSER